MSLSVFVTSGVMGMIEASLSLISLALAVVSLTAVALLYRARKPADFRGVNSLLEALAARWSSRFREVEAMLQEAAGKAEKALAQASSFNDRLEGQHSSLNTVMGSLKTLMEAQIRFSKALGELHEALLKVSGRISSVETAVRSLRRGMPAQRLKPTVQLKTEQREISLANLTPTEMEVLRLLYVSGPKTASEIREVIGKTREHTARLMKKLYLEGYVERSTESIPFTYRLSEKIRKSLEFSVRKSE